MNQEQLESLPYPMFETTEVEKYLLRYVIDNLSLFNYYVCCVLEDLKTDYNQDTVETLCIKIRVTTGQTLMSYLQRESPKLATHLKEEGNSDMLQLKMRDIWIRKLLAYSPE